MRVKVRALRLRLGRCLHDRLRAVARGRPEPELWVDRQQLVDDVFEARRHLRLKSQPPVRVRAWHARGTRVHGCRIGPCPLHAQMYAACQVTPLPAKYDSPDSPAWRALSYRRFGRTRLPASGT